MNGLSITSLVLFGVFSLIELGATKFNANKVRYVSSPILIPLLILFYVSHVQNKNWLIIAALGFGFLGDIFMLWQEKEVLVISNFKFDEGKFKFASKPAIKDGIFVANRRFAGK